MEKNKFKIIKILNTFVILWFVLWCIEQYIFSNIIFGIDFEYMYDNLPMDSIIVIMIDIFESLIIIHPILTIISLVFTIKEHSSKMDRTSKLKLEVMIFLLLIIVLFYLYISLKLFRMYVGGAV